VRLPLNLAVEEEDGVKGLVLGADGHVAPGSQLGEKAFELGFAGKAHGHLTGRAGDHLRTHDCGRKWQKCLQMETFWKTLLPSLRIQVLSEDQPPAACAMASNLVRQQER